MVAQQRSTTAHHLTKQHFLLLQLVFFSMYNYTNFKMNIYFYAAVHCAVCSVQYDPVKKHLDVFINYKSINHIFYKELVVPPEECI